MFFFNLFWIYLIYR